YAFARAVAARDRGARRGRADRPARRRAAAGGLPGGGLSPLLGRHAAGPRRCLYGYSADDGEVADPACTAAAGARAGGVRHRPGMRGKAMSEQQAMSPKELRLVIRLLNKLRDTANHITMTGGLQGGEQYLQQQYEAILASL